MLRTLAVALAAAPMAHAGDVPEAPVTMSVNAYGVQYDGILVVNADTLASLGVLFGSKDDPKTGAFVPLELGMWVHVGSRSPERFKNAIAGLMLLDLNDDLRLDTRDTTFAAISLFTDRDGNQTIGPGELRSFGDIGIASITNTGEVRLAVRESSTGASTP